jgi:hypothetical protein
MPCPSKAIPYNKQPKMKRDTQQKSSSFFSESNLVIQYIVGYFPQSNIISQKEFRSLK